MNNELQQQSIPMRDYPLVTQAAYDTVHGHKGGATALGPELDKSPATLSNEVNPKQMGHKLGLLDSIYLQQRTHNFSILLHYAAALGHTVVPIGDFSGISDIELLKTYSQWHAELGDVNKVLNKALTDNDLEPHELEDIEREFNEATQAGLAFISRCRAIVSAK